MTIGTAIRHLKHGDWKKAHEMVRHDDTQPGCWAHGIAHLIEGDLGNARYWYRKAGRPFPVSREAGPEIDALAAVVRKRPAA